MISNSDNIEEIKSDRRFWSPVAIFFLGVPFAALNWWRMGWKRKAIVFLCISIAVRTLNLWLQPSEFLRYTDVISQTQFYFFQLLLQIIFNLILSIIMFYDIQTFNAEKEKSHAVNWKVIFLFALPLALITIGIEFTADYFYKDSKYCHFPRLQDLLYENITLNQQGAKNMLTNYYALNSGCVFWGIESYNNSLVASQNEISDSASYIFFGRLKNNQNSSIELRQQVEIHQNTVSQTLVDSLVSNRQSFPLIFEIKIEAPHANYVKYKCWLSGPDKDCHVVLGYNNVISWLQITQSGLSDKEFETILSGIISDIDKRIYQHEINASKAK
jgi:predicted membrane protein